MVPAYKAVAAAVAFLLKSGALIQEPAFKAIGQMTGTDTTVEVPRVELIRDQAAWLHLWREHRAILQLNVPTGAPPPSTADDSDRPKVDFTKEMVLCLFGGQSRNIGGFHVVEVGDVKNVAYVRVAPLLLPDSGAGLLQNPYIFITIPRTKRKIIVQLDQSALGAQGWRTLATFDSPSVSN
jgi:hypothetical protein